MQIILSVDIGTTHCKGIAMNKAGKILYSEKNKYSIDEDANGKSEQDPDEIFAAVIQLLQQLLQKAMQQQYEVKAVCFSAALHSVIAVDKNGKPLTKAITWADTRSKNYTDKLLQSTHIQSIYEHTGTPVHPMAPLSKILWLKNERPDIFKQAYKFISVKEYVFFKLFGKYIIDHSIASGTGLFDTINLTWNEDALQAAGINAVQLSQPVPVIHAERELQPKYAIALQIKESIPFIAGGNDGAMANIGSGAVVKGEAALTIGTSGAVRITTDVVQPDKKQRLFNYIICDKLYISGGPTNNGGNVLNWLSHLFEETNTEALLQQASAIEAGASKLIFLPYLLGERAPIWNADARATFFGLNISHTKAHLTRAALEGVCFSLYEIILTLEELHGAVNKIYISGGFMASEFWVQLLADITGKKLIISNNNDASVTGAAYIAMLALGWIKDLKETKAFLKEEKMYKYNYDAHQTYQKLFKIYQCLYPNLKEAFTQLSNL